MACASTGNWYTGLRWNLCVRGLNTTRRTMKASKLRYTHPPARITPEQMDAIRLKLGIAYGYGRALTAYEVSKLLEAHENGGLVR